MPKYLLLTMGWYRRLWWVEEEPGLNCTSEQRERVLQSSLAVTDEYFLDEVKDVNLTSTPGIVSSLVYFFTLAPTVDPWIKDTLEPAIFAFIERLSSKN